MIGPFYGHFPSDDRFAVLGNLPRMPTLGVKARIDPERGQWGERVTETAA